MYFTILKNEKRLKKKIHNIMIKCSQFQQMNKELVVVLLWMLNISYIQLEEQSCWETWIIKKSSTSRFQGVTNGDRQQLHLDRIIWLCWTHVIAATQILKSSVFVMFYHLYVGSFSTLFFEAVAEIKQMLYNIRSPQYNLKRNILFHEESGVYTECWMNRLQSA